MQPDVIAFTVPTTGDDAGMATMVFEACANWQSLGDHPTGTIHVYNVRTQTSVKDSGDF